MRIYTIVPITEVRQNGLMFIKLPAPYSQSLKWGISLLASTLLIASDQIRFWVQTSPMSACVAGNDKCISNFQTWKCQSSPSDRVTPQTVGLCDVIVPRILLSLLDLTSPLCVSFQTTSKCGLDLICRN